VVFNHPDKIKQNRNKLTALEVMKKAGVAVADFEIAEKAVDDLGKENGLKLPLVGRKKYHQGGADFWTCLTKHQIERAIQQGAQYFQNYIDIADEYRLHIVGGELVHAQKKTERDNMAEAFIEQTIANVKNAAERKGEVLDEDTLKKTAEQLAKKQQGHADLIVRSNTRGYKFSNVKLENVKDALLEEAKKALVALDLQFGAVDCCLDTDGKAWVIEVNTGPGLEGTSFDRYKDALVKLIDGVLNPKKAPAKEKKAPAKVAADAPLKTGSKKDKLAQKAALMQEMIAAADENEAEVLDGLFGKMFG
jgi:glutathione synthase/RimK-type ligase-like ATP-grasp enzyme